MVIIMDLPFTLSKEDEKFKEKNIVSTLSKISERLEDEEKQEIAFFISNIVQSAKIAGMKKAEMLGDSMQKKMLMMIMLDLAVSGISAAAVLYLVFG